MTESKTGSVRCAIGGTELHIRNDMTDVEGTMQLDYTVLADRKVTLNAKKAEEYIDLPIFKGEREVVEAHVQRLYDEMRRGNFNELLVTLSTAEMGGITYKVNGQHTCWAVVFMHSVIPNFELQVREIRYRVDNAEQLRMLYATYDRLMTRTDTHITKVHLVDVPETIGIPPSTIQRIVPGLKFWLFEHIKERQRYPPEQVATLVRQHHAALFRAVAKFYQENNEPHLKRAPIAGAIFATFDKTVTKATEFWRPVASGLELDSKSDPRWRLRDMLLNTSLNAGSEKRSTDPETLYRVAIQAWNKWRTGESASVTIRPTKERVKPR